MKGTKCKEDAVKRFLRNNRGVIAFVLLPIGVAQVVVWGTVLYHLLLK